MYSHTQFVRKFLIIFNHVIIACILLLHFHALHTLTSLFYIYTYAKIFTFTF